MRAGDIIDGVTYAVAPQGTSQFARSRVKAIVRGGVFKHPKPLGKPANAVIVELCEPYEGITGLVQDSKKGWGVDLQAGDRLSVRTSDVLEPWTAEHDERRRRSAEAKEVTTRLYERAARLGLPERKRGREFFDEDERDKGISIGVSGVTIGRATFERWLDTIERHVLDGLAEET